MTSLRSAETADEMQSPPGAFEPDVAEAAGRHDDPRLQVPSWDASARPSAVGLRALVVVELIAAGWYFTWLLQPSRVGAPVLYVLLVAAELFNLVQAAGFWWTAVRDRPRPAVAPLRRHACVDVLIPVYGEPVDVVEPTVAGATRLAGADVLVHLLDDGGDPEMALLARRWGANYIARDRHHGAKAGNINHALQRTGGEFVVVLDCDHVPMPELLTETLGHFADDRVAFVQTPQYYANSAQSPIAAAAWAQQALFFGTIARGKDALGSMFCGGTNVVLRRAALADTNGFPEESVTEDFELSIRMHERGWRSAYVPRVLAQGLGPTDMASYVGQQLRWSRGCVSAIASALRARLPLRIRLQYLLSSMYFLTGWTLLIYMLLPITRMTTGAQPFAAAGSDQFLVHFVPYFALALIIVAKSGRGSYTFAAFALSSACWWVHATSTVRALLRRPGRFVVTPKHEGSAWQPRAVLPTLVTVAALLGASGWALAHGASPSTLNNVCFALLHITVLMCGAAGALGARRGPRTTGGSLPQ